LNKTIKARYVNGKFEPLENVELKEGDEVLLLVTHDVGKRAIQELIASKSRRSGPEPDGFDRAAGSWKGTLDFDAFMAEIQESRKLDRPPVDFEK
jgi:predicted DNA-binding antitoxin AbrB/MazE fold protein